LVIGGYTATGFIVDAARGIILTNRHVVSPAPIVAQAVLTNYEEVDLKPVYRDPVHDFGFMQVWEKKSKSFELYAKSLFSSTPLALSLWS
jgi:S1-C subfamily serine protease